jgi:hypothetical protein
VCDLEREIGLTLRGRILEVHVFTIPVTKAGYDREQTGLARRGVVWALITGFAIQASKKSAFFYSYGAMGRRWGEPRATAKAATPPPRGYRSIALGAYRVFLFLSSAQVTDVDTSCEIDNLPPTSVRGKRQFSRSAGRRAADPKTAAILIGHR